MAKFEVSAADEYIDLLQGLQKEKTQKIISMSIYDGAGIIADEIKSELEKLDTFDNMHLGPTEIEKKDMISGFGISPMKITDGDMNVKIGFDGYGSKPTKKHPKGVPIPLTVRSIISGTSFRNKNNFIKRAVNKKKKKAIEKMNQTINENFQKEMKDDG